MIVVYNFNNNNILVDPFKKIQEGTIKITWSLINDTLSNGGVMLKLYLLDNEAQLELKEFTVKINQVSVSPSAYSPHKYF